MTIDQILESAASNVNEQNSFAPYPTFSDNGGNRGRASYDARNTFKPYPHYNVMGGMQNTAEVQLVKDQNSFVNDSGEEKPAATAFVEAKSQLTSNLVFAVVTGLAGAGLFWALGQKSKYIGLAGIGFAAGAFVSLQYKSIVFPKK